MKLIQFNAFKERLQGNNLAFHKNLLFERYNSVIQLCTTNIIIVDMLGFRYYYFMFIVYICN